MHGPGGNLNGADQLLIVSGSMGAGKTAGMAAASDILAQGKIAHAAIDMDAFGVTRFSSAAQNDEVMFRNLACVLRNCAEEGIGRILLERAALEDFVVVNENRAITGIAREMLTMARWIE